MKRRYFDNAATSFPKPPTVMAAMERYARELGASPGRGAYREAREAGELLWRCRERICTLINGAAPDHVVFTLNTSDALNLAIKGVIRPADRGTHVVTTWMDHNSVLRPLNALADELGIEQTRVEAEPETGLVDPEDIRRAIRPGTKLVAAVHGSNVTGTVQNISAIGRVCREAGVPLLVDAAQTLGHIPVDVQALCIDLLAFPGHKGLLGPLGTGGLYLRPGMERLVRTVREGGTGSVSESDMQPRSMPDKYEPGSHNAIGIIGLSEGVAWLLERGVESVAAHERALTTRFLDGLRGDDAGWLPGLRLLGPPTAEDRVGVFSVVVEGMTPSRLSDLLEQRYGILTRPGLHCAPLVHRAFGRNPERVGEDHSGATRFSLGPFLTESDVDEATGALAEICRTVAAHTPAPT